MDSSKRIYLDAAASASSSEFAVVDDFANPNSIHEAGRDAFAVLEDARETIAKLIGAKRPSEIIFTSGATEANNIAILGMARAISSKTPGNITPDPKMRKRNKIIVFEIEHESALRPAMHLEREGFEVEMLPTDRLGFAKLLKYGEICDSRTALVIVQHANTEIGSIQNIKELCEIAHESGALFHCDCVGTFGWIPVDVNEMGIDSASFSGHKIGGPKGIGALYLKSGVKCEPLMYGGPQENGLVPGTQAVALASAFAKAAKTSVESIPKTREQFKELCKYLIGEIYQTQDVRLTIDASENQYGFLWNILNLTFANMNNKDLILQYGKRGIVVSGGPACSADSDEPSHVLRALGIPADKLNNSIRISFNANTTLDDAQKFIAATKEILGEN